MGNGTTNVDNHSTTQSQFTAKFNTKLKLYMQFKLFESIQLTFIKYYGKRELYK